jgi:hypothetical protein
MTGSAQRSNRAASLVATMMNSSLYGSRIVAALDSSPTGAGWPDSTHAGGPSSMPNRSGMVIA